MRVGFSQSIVAKNNYAFKGQKINPVDASFINEERLVDTFTKLVQIDSGSDEALAEKKTPTTKGQKNVAAFLKKALTEAGVKDVEVDEYSYVYGTIEGNIKDGPTVGLIAHMDTSPDAPNKGVKPQIHNYVDGDLRLNDETVIPAKKLEHYKGQKIITSDGTTLLGADDKAGIAEILEAIKVFREHPEIKHPKIRIAFTPDEEVGAGTFKFDREKFGADFAYTIDGDLPHVVEDESFNAFKSKILIEGKMTHWGSAKADGMVDALEIGTWIMNKVPKGQRPRTTEGRQGYYFVSDFQGNTTKAEMTINFRDFSIKQMHKRLAYIQDIVNQAKEEFHGAVSFDPREVYPNMKRKFAELPQVIDYAKQALRLSGLVPMVSAIRGGTDGSKLSIEGLLTANLAAGGQNFHAENEFVVIKDMDKCTENIINLGIVLANKYKKIMPEVFARRIH